MKQSVMYQFFWGMYLGRSHGTDVSGTDSGENRLPLGDVLALCRLLTAQVGQAIQRPTVSLFNSP